MSTSYQPPYTLTPSILRLATEIGEAVGRLAASAEVGHSLRRRRANPIHTIRGLLANADYRDPGETVGGGAARRSGDTQRALQVYDGLEQWQPESESDLLEAH